jgi:hypothetical protein
LLSGQIEGHSLDPFSARTINVLNLRTGGQLMAVIDVDLLRMIASG